MLALECASRLTQRLNLFYEPVGEADVQAVCEALQENSSDRCPDSPRIAVSAAVESLMHRAGAIRDDDLFGVWALAREEVISGPGDAQGLWLVQLARRLLPREALDALLGLERSTSLELIGCDEVIAETSRQQELGLCDNHLHSGAADELGELLARLIPRVADDAAPRDLQGAIGPDARKETLNAAPLVLALAAACALLGFDGDPESASVKIVADEAWWQRIRQLAYAGPRIDASEFKALQESIQSLSGSLGMAPQLSDLYRALKEISAGARLEATKLEASRRGLIALASLYGLIAVPRNSSLGIFVKRFDLMRAVRRLFGEDSGRLASALRTMYLDDRVHAVELRKSVVPRSERTVSVKRIESSIHKDIEEHARGALAACKNLKIDDLIVRMPLTFTRRDTEPVDLSSEADGYVPFRAPVAETLAVADAIVQVTQNDLQRRFVGAVDLVGNEKKVPNWLYAIAYQRIAGAESSGLEFACHAGEYFGDQVEGLRRIGEVALFRPARVRRIGHCLALQIGSGVDSEGDGAATGTLLENLAWVTLLLDGSSAECFGEDVTGPDAPEAFQRELNRVLLLVASEVFGSEVSVSDVRSWYLARFDLASMSHWISDLGKTTPEESLSWPRGVSRETLPDPIDLAEAMVATSIYDMSIDVRTSSGTQRVQYDPFAAIPANAATKARALLREASAFAREHVLSWLQSNGMVIETCPSSNAALIELPDRQHPIWKFHQEDLACSVSTDDPALFGASLSEEYAHIGMVAQSEGDDGAPFVAVIAEKSRSVGMIEQPLCDPSAKPIDVYRALA